MEPEFIECDVCNGSGQVDTIVNVCLKPISQCCGGCSELGTCNNCNGSGEVENPDWNPDINEL